MDTKKELAESGNAVPGLLEKAAGEFRRIGSRITEEVGNLEVRGDSCYGILNLQQIAIYCEGLGVWFTGQVRSPDYEAVRHVASLGK